MIINRSSFQVPCLHKNWKEATALHFLVSYVTKCVLKKLTKFSWVGVRDWENVDKSRTTRPAPTCWHSGNNCGLQFFLVVL